MTSIMRIPKVQSGRVESFRKSSYFSRILFYKMKKEGTWEGIKKGMALA